MGVEDACMYIYLDRGRLDAGLGGDDGGGSGVDGVDAVVNTSHLGNQSQISYQELGFGSRSRRRREKERGG